MAVHPDVLKRVLVLILAGGRGERLDPLTRNRSKPSVPFGGTFRIIDFTLANAVNSGFRRICLLTQYKATSLMRHINAGWNILSHELGEFIYSIPPQLRVSDTWYLGTADAVYQNIYTIEREEPDLVLILAGDHIYRMDYREMLASHIAHGAAVTLATTRMAKEECRRFGVIDADEDGWLRQYTEKPEQVGTAEATTRVNMGIFLFDRKTLVEALAADATRAGSRHDFGYDILPDLLGSGVPIYAHEFSSAGDKPEPYWRDLGTRDAYYAANMDLVSVSPQFNLYDRNWPVRSAAIQAPPAKFVFSAGDVGRVGQAHDSLVSPGVIVSGGQVSRSIVGPHCRINSWSTVEDSILMDGVEIGRHAVVRRAIIDKGVRVPAGAQIGVDALADRNRFEVTRSGIVMIPRDHRF